MGFEEFEIYFSEIYGSRWPALLAALKKSEIQIARFNQFSSEAPSLSLWNSLPGCYEGLGGELPRDSQNLLQYYVMDPASVFAARALGVEAGDQVLDMCAAPGGKSLILIEALAASGEIQANEMSAGRRERLKKVIQQYVPRSVRDRVWVTGKEGGLFAKSHPGYFDKILVDAPCSGERHLLQSPKDLKEWSFSRSKKLAQRQYALLTAALEAINPGGRIVYSTCSISPLENDEVIERLIEKKGERVEVEALPDDLLGLLGGEKTRCGLQYFPDQCGFGPIYFCALKAK